MTRHLRLPALAATFFVAALGLAACGNNATSQTSTSPSSSSTSSPSATPSSTDSPSASATPTSTSGGAAPSTAPVAGSPARCVSSQLKASLGPGAGGAAGHVYSKIVLTNTSSTPCLLAGFAGVSLTAGPDGGPIGAPADRDNSVPVTNIVLQPGQSGGADFGYTQPGLYGGSCTQVQAAGIRIYPPEDYGSVFIAQPETACSETSIHLLTLKAFQPM
ncbi:DUF4232 domain-containing protein [Sinomonas humi]|uniref:DUF4232 domain-containing protein n=1 Tax=Sinomonas humi TaxID=1338436 RepID=UPI001E5C09CB|nr:DUF4232 domain-containing protein [Sinomonas humi]